MKRMNYFPLLLVFGLATGNSAHANDVSSQNFIDHPRQWTIDGATREALVSAPAAAKTAPSPVVFVFHGHGGNMKNMATKFAYHKFWPEAITVYMQGLNTPGMTDPEGKKSGWQKMVGDQGDRDLKFFEAVLATLKQDYRIDTKRIYVTGFSNGAGFTYLLWSHYGDLFAAVAPCASAAQAVSKEHLKPLPVFHLAGKKDPVAKFEWQQQVINEVKKINGCSDQGESWGENEYCTLYPSKTNTPVIACIHAGGHLIPNGAPAVIIKFFKQYAKP